MIDIAKMTDERGFKIAATGQKLIIHPAQQFIAERIMKSANRVGTADNDINALASMGMIPQGYVVNNFIADDDAFYIKTDVPNGLKHMVRAPIKTAMEGDFETGNVRYKARKDTASASLILEVYSDHQARNRKVTNLLRGRLRPPFLFAITILKAYIQRNTDLTRRPRDCVN